MVIDTNHRTTTKLSSLAANGVTAIIRYYARFTQQREKRLIRNEAEAILNAGMSIAVVHQAAGDQAAACGAFFFAPPRRRRGFFFFPSAASASAGAAFISEPKRVTT